MSLRSLSLSLSKVVTEQSAQNVMIFSPKKKGAKRQTREFFQRHKKISSFAVFFPLLLFPSQPYNILYSQHITNNTNETEERNESKNDEKEYLFCTRACVCRNSAVLLFSQTRKNSSSRVFSFRANVVVSSNSTSSESRQEANERDSRQTQSGIFETFWIL